MPPSFTNYPAPRGHIFTSTLLNASFIYKLPCTPWTYLYIHTTKCLLHLQTTLHPVDISLHPTTKPAPRGHIFTSTLLNASFIYKLPCTPWTYLYIHTTKPSPRGHIFTSTLLNASFIYKLPCTPWTYLYIHTTKCDKFEGKKQYKRCIVKVSEKNIFAIFFNKALKFPKCITF